ncbi:Mu-like prophage I protein [Mycolicibacterium aurum]|uniref:Mu-like prophage I protein n=1 Tax=Mycolicibacterium aurum TaxID=1791 RepID=A0A448IT32_MYCAU|nr:hypothetical protein [Mycolicibacterium aurum]VEG55642.1 Mu-like prophage I protein [Mycolicibacterium aurum]
MEFTPEQIAALLGALGLPDDTADPQLVVDTALDLAAQLGDPAKASTIAASAKRAGLEVLDNDTAAALRRDAAEGRTIKAAAAKAKVEASVDAAVSRGAITAARKKFWVSLIEADPDMAEVLAKTPDELAVPLSEVGHSADNTGDLAEPAPWFYA